MACWSKDRTLQFIEFYRSYECLWKVKSKDYSNKLKRERAYEELTNFVKTFYPNANKDTVISKISNLRGSWRKENKKMMTSHASGAGEEDIYEPSLFYFDSLSFIADSEIPRKGREINDNVDVPAFESREQDKDDDSQEQSFDSTEVDVDYHVDQNFEGSSQVTPGPSTRPVPKEVPSQKRQIIKRKASQEDDLLMLACQKLKGPSVDTAPRDEFDSFGQSIAHDLRGMSRQQFIHAKKLISEVIYEGQLDNLSRYSKVVAVDESYNTAGPYPRMRAEPAYTLTSSTASQFSSPNHEVYRNYPC